MRSNFKIQCALVLAATLGFAGRSDAALVFELSSVFEGSAPSGSGPWATATFTDVMGGVQLTLDNYLVGSGEFLDEWAFNLDPSLDPTLLDFTLTDGADVASAGVATGVNFYQADGDGLYDIKIDFPPPPGNFDDKFTGGESVTFLITSSQSIWASSFDFLSFPAGGHGPFPTAAHIQGIDGGLSAWTTVTVPIPGAALLGLIGAGTLGWWMRRKT